MASAKQKKAAKRNIKKAQAKWRSMSGSAKAGAQPQGRGRARPGTKGKGNFYRIVVRPKSEFVTFRNHDVGTKGHLQRLAGRRKNGSWATQAWLIAKTDSRVSNGILVGKTSDAKKLLSKLQGTPKKVRGDIFKCRPRKNIPEKTKPTPAMRKAQTKNIKKAQAARRKKRK